MNSKNGKKRQSTRRNMPPVGNHHPPSNGSNSCGKCINGLVIAREGNLCVAKECPECTVACSKCEGVGHVYKEDASGRMYTVDCECSEIKQRISRFNAARLPALFMKPRYDFKHFYIYEGNRGLSKMFNEIKRYTKESQNKKPPHGIILGGPPGTGKTHLLVSILKTFSLNYGKRCSFVEFAHLISEIKSTFNSNHGSQSEIIDRVIKNDVIFIDELARGMMTEWQSNILDELITKIYNEEKTLIATTNLALSTPGASRDMTKTLEESLSPMCYSRLVETSKMYDCIAMDYRKKLAP